MTAPDVSEAFGPVLPAYEGQCAHETCSGKNGLQGLEEWHCRLERHQVQQKLFLGDFPDYIVSLVSYRTSYLMNPANAATKNTTLNKTSIPQ